MIPLKEENVNLTVAFETSVIRWPHAMSAHLTLDRTERSSDERQNVANWPTSELATRLIEVRSVRHCGLDLLALSSSHFDPQRSLRAVTHRNAALPGRAMREII